MEKAYKKYAEVLLEIKALEAQRETLKEEVLEALRKEPDGRKETGFGKFTLSGKKVWTYSDKIKAMNEKLKIAQEKEQKKGIAKATITEYVTFTSPKKEDEF